MSNATQDDQWKFNFKLEREDEWGRRMTPKEAFREFCWKFHGIKPGKAKQEQRMKQAEEEMKQKGMAVGDTPLHAMAKIREVTLTLTLSLDLTLTLTLTLTQGYGLLQVPHGP